MSVNKKPLYKPLIPGYETDLPVTGTHDIGRTYKFSVISVAQCEEIIATGSQHVRRVAAKKPRTRGDETAAEEPAAEN